VLALWGSEILRTVGMALAAMAVVVIGTVLVVPRLAASWRAQAATAPREVCSRTLHRARKLARKSFLGCDSPVPSRVSCREESAQALGPSGGNPAIICCRCINWRGMNSAMLTATTSAAPSMSGTSVPSAGFVPSVRAG
jgi:hypothetical protein